jgi:hypothetical protein
MSLRDTPKHENSRAAVPAAMAGETPALRNLRSRELDECTIRHVAKLLAKFGVGR